MLLPALWWWLPFLSTPMLLVLRHWLFACLRHLWESTRRGRSRNLHAELVHTIQDPCQAWLRGLGGLWSGAAEDDLRMSFVEVLDPNQLKMHAPDHLEDDRTWLQVQVFPLFPWVALIQGSANGPF